MNISKKGLTVLTAGLMGYLCVITTTYAAGSIKIREKDINHECSIPATVGDHALDRRGCTNDQAYTVRFVDVPSALNITFFSDRKNDYCKKDSEQDWIIETRTLKNTTTTEDYIGIGTMAHIADNTLIAPGLLKIRLVHRRGDYYGKLSCVRIENHK